jgi:hypothetical protein
MAEAPGSTRKVVITTLEIVINGLPALARLTQPPVSLKIAQRFLKLKQVIDDISKAFNVRRNALISAHGVATGDNAWKLDPAQMEGFRTELVTVLKEEVRLPQEVCISLADLADVKISADDLEKLAFVLLDL